VLAVEYLPDAFTVPSAFLIIATDFASQRVHLRFE
jgi:hypothetical protein